MKVCELENKLLEKFPASMAYSWDNTGLLVGDENAKIEGVAICLDPTLEALEEAEKQNCNVLLTHHPAFMKEAQFSNFVLGRNFNSSISNLVYVAIKKNISLMNFHTALDVSDVGNSTLPSLLGFKKIDVLCPVSINNDKNLGIGPVCVPDTKEWSNSVTLDMLVDKCKLQFKRTPRVWVAKNSCSSTLNKVAFVSGSCGRLSDSEDSVLYKALQSRIDAVVCGEIKYHDAVVCASNNLSIIELGHDVSEIPFNKILYNSVVSVGLDSDFVHILQLKDNWK